MINWQDTYEDGWAGYVAGMPDMPDMPEYSRGWWDHYA